MSVKPRLPYSSRDKFSGRYPSLNDGQLSVRVDPIQRDVDEEISGLHEKVHRLKHVAQVIESETKFQNELLNQLESTMLKAQAGLRSTMKRLNRSIIQNGSNHVMHVILFLFLCVFFIIIWSKFFRSR
ncbi:unnamed protein product [Calypogeia fissa]